MSKRRKQEGGFALLFVFVMAAAIAITLFMELPRVAFEVQRGKEQLLVDRGEQYKRAIQIFYRKNKRDPANMDELEKYQEMRFLRHRYKDPFTGKEEWRLIHVGAGGVLTDSLIQKANPLGGKDAKGQNADGSQNPGFQQTNTTAANGQPDPNDATPGGLNMATARRPSDKMAGGQTQGAPVDPNNPNAPPVAPQDPNQAQQQPPQQPQQPPLYPGQVQQYPGQVQQLPGQVQQFPGQVQQFPGQVQQTQFTGQAPPNPGQPQFPGQPQLPGQPGFPQPVQNANNPYPQPQPNGQPSGQPTTALGAIQQAIFSPRQPPAGVGSSFGNGSNTLGGGGGIAGVATTYKGPSIKVINEHQKYQEWEFVYDLKKDKSVMGPAAGQNGAGGAGMNGANGMNGGTQNGAGFGSFGGGSGTGTGQGGFGGGPPMQPTTQR